MKRIGFIAMSGVRAHNAELTQLGLTLPGFVDRNKIIASLPSLGLLTLAGLTPKQFDVQYHEIADLRRVEAGVPPAVEPGVPPGGKCVASGLARENSCVAESLCAGSGRRAARPLRQAGRLTPQRDHFVNF